LNSVYTFPINGTCPAGSQRVFASREIRFPYKISRISVGFPLGTNRTLQLRFLIAGDEDETIPTGNIPPTGQNILRPFTETDFVVGDDETKILAHQVEELSNRSFLKVWATNLDGFDHTVDVLFEIEALAPIPKEPTGGKK
jgi:hypothetical protein